jgi:hypothetical protein
VAVFWRASALSALALWAVACDCGGDTGLHTLKAKIGVDPMSLDFGAVPVGATKHLSLAVGNSGTAVLDLSAVKVDAPFTATVAAAQIAPGGSGPIDVAFLAVNLGIQTRTVTISSDAVNAATLEVKVVGNAATSSLAVDPRSIDFSGTAVGEARSAAIIVSNSSSVAGSGALIASGFLRPEHFTLTSLADFKTPGQYFVGAAAATELELAYRPIAAGNDDGRILFETCGAGCGLEVVVHASAIEPVLQAVPAFLDFGTVAIGQAKELLVLLTNNGSQPAPVNQVRIGGSQDVTVAAAPPAPRALGPGEKMSISVTYQPTSATALSNAELVIDTTEPNLPELFVGITGQGSGSLFVVEPSAIDFGVVARALPTRRGVQLLNAGSAPLDVSALSLSGDPAFMLVDLPGLPASLGPGESITPFVSFTPSGTPPVTFTATLSIASSDGLHPMVSVPVRGEYAQLRCKLALDPVSLEFGLVASGSSRSITATLQNAGTEDCTLISGHFLPPADPAFALAPVVWPVTLGAGATTQLAFSYAPTEAVTSAKKAFFAIGTDDPAMPVQEIVLRASPELISPAAGRWLLFWQIGALGGDIMKLGLQSTSPPTAVFGPATGQHCVGCHSVSPDGRFLAVIDIDRFQVRIVELGSGLDQPLGFVAQSAMTVSWRPDLGAVPPYQFAYDDGQVIQIASVMGGSLGPLAGADLRNGLQQKMPSWGPNGQIAFVRGMGHPVTFDVPSDVMLIDQSGGMPMPLTGASGTGNLNYYPAFSPDGNWIAFTTSAGHGPNGSYAAPDAQILVVAADGSGRFIDAAGLNVAGFASSYPTWSHDGSFLSFSSDRPGGLGGWDIWYAPFDTANGNLGMPLNLMLANTPGFEHSAIWSP